MKRPAPSPMSNEARNSYVIEQITRALTAFCGPSPSERCPSASCAPPPGVGRASFYRNFDSKEAVLQRQDEALLRRWQRDYDTAKARALTEGREPDNLMVSLLMFYKENRDFYTLVYRNDSRILLGTILKICGPVPEDANATAYAKAFIAYGIYGAVSEWIRRGMTESAEELGRPAGPREKTGSPDPAPQNVKKSRPDDMRVRSGLF